MSSYVFVVAQNTDALSQITHIDTNTPPQATKIKYDDSKNKTYKCKPNKKAKSASIPIINLNGHRPKAFGKRNKIIFNYQLQDIREGEWVSVQFYVYGINNSTKDTIIAQSKDWCGINRFKAGHSDSVYTAILTMPKTANEWELTPKSTIKYEAKRLKTFGGIKNGFVSLYSPRRAKGNTLSETTYLETEEDFRCNNNGGIWTDIFYYGGMGAALGYLSESEQTPTPNNSPTFAPKNRNQGALITAIIVGTLANLINVIRVTKISKNNKQNWEKKYRKCKPCHL